MSILFTEIIICGDVPNPNNESEQTKGAVSVLRRTINCKERGWLSRLLGLSDPIMPGG